MSSPHHSEAALPTWEVVSQLPTEERRALFNQMIQRRFIPFLAWAARVMVGRDQFLMNWHLRTLGHHLDQIAEGKIKRLIITLPPRSLKSLTASVAFPAWLLGSKPNMGVLCVSYSNELASDHASSFRRLIERPEYKAAFPELDFSSGRNTQLIQRSSQGGFRLATSVNGTITGRGGDVVIIDDPIRAGGIMSQAERTSVNTWFGQTLLSRLNDPEKSAIIVIMQRLHEDDLVGHLLAEADHGWNVLNIPAVAEQEIIYPLSYKRNDVFVRQPGSLIDGRRMGADALKEIRDELGEFHFNAQYQQNPTPFGGNIVKSEHLHRYDDAALAAAKVGRHMVLQSWDTAQKAGETNDFSVCTTYLVTQTGLLLWNVFRDRLEADELLAGAKRLAQEFSANQILVEDIQGGTGLIQQLRKQISAKVIARIPQEDKEARLMAVQFMIRQGGVLLPETALWLPAFERELLSFPAGRHDDQVDSFTQALNYLRPMKIGGVRYDRDGRSMRTNPLRRSGSRANRTGQPRTDAPTKYGELSADQRRGALGS